MTVVLMNSLRRLTQCPCRCSPTLVDIFAGKSNNSERRRPRVLARVSSSYVKSDITNPILPDVWEFSTEPYGKLVYNAPFHVRVQPLDPVKFPRQDRIQVTMKNEEEHLTPDWMKAVECQVDLDPRDRVLRVTADLTESGYSLFPSPESLPVSIDVFVPVKFDADVTTRHHGRVAIEGLECDAVDVRTEGGQSNLGNLKVSRMRIASSRGDINCRGSVYGDVCLTTAGAGAIDMHKLQGSLYASTEAGALMVKAAYVTRSSISSFGGGIRVSTLSGLDNQVFSIHGDIILDSVDGCLEASTMTGDMDVTFSRVPDAADSSSSIVARLTSESGDVVVKVESDVDAFLDVTAGGAVDVDERLRNDEASANASCNNDEESLLSSNKDSRTKLKVGRRPSDAVVEILTKRGKVALARKDWFAASKFAA